MATNGRLYDHQLFATRADQALPSEPQAPEIERAIGKTHKSSSIKRTVSGPPPPGGPMALLDAYHDLLRDAVRQATERGFVRSWDDEGLPQVKVLVGPRDKRGRAECLLVLRAQAAFDFAWRMYDWAMGQKRAAERALDGSGIRTLWRADA